MADNSRTAQSTKSGPDIFRGIPRPQNDAELEIVSEWYFGIPLHFRSLHVWGSGGRYEVEEDFDSIPRFGRSGYDEHHLFWNWVTGPMEGVRGTARACYGGFKITSYRQQKRLEGWVSSRRKKDGSSVRRPFVRLAERITGSEGTPRSATRGVPTSGRVDGALAVSLSGGQS